ncbi:hypothetical protein S83_040149 [Arachis hypogaea]
MHLFITIVNKGFAFPTLKYVQDNHHAHGTAYFTVIIIKKAQALNLSRVFFPIFHKILRLLLFYPFFFTLLESMVKLGYLEQIMLKARLSGWYGDLKTVFL